MKFIFSTILLIFNSPIFAATAPLSTCNDFTGKWAGHCKLENSDSIVEGFYNLRISSDCESLSFNGTDPATEQPYAVIQINGKPSKSFSFFSEDYIYLYEETADFLDDTKLLFKVIENNTKIEIATGQKTQGNYYESIFSLTDDQTLGVKYFEQGNLTRTCVFTK